MPTKTTKTTKATEPKKTAAKAAATKTAATKTAATKTSAAKTSKPAAAKSAPTKSTAAKTTKPAASPTAKKAGKAAGQTTIADTVRAVVDAAAAIVGAAVTVNAAVGPKKGKTGKRITKALDVAEGVTAAAVALVNLNRAAPDALASLKGIGPKRAQKIVESRPFQAVDDLAARKLLPKKAVDELRGKLSV